MPETADKITVSNLFKVFGKRPEQALELLRAGKDKEHIFQQTGSVVGVRDASFSVREGEIFVLMGLSGSGKSTLIRLINRLMEPTAGQILLGGRDITTMPARELVALRRKDMAMVFQSFALLPHLSVLRNTAFGLEVAGVARAARERRAMEVLEQVGLRAFAHKLPSELSGGMQQRVGLARALAVDPTLMLMDEAFSALDPLKRTEMQGLLLELQREQRRTIVFVSHDLDEAFRIGDRIAIMEGGRIVQIGTPDEILRNPSEAYVQAFFQGVDVRRYLQARDVAQAEGVPVVRTASGAQDCVPAMSALMQQLQQSGQSHAFVVDGAGCLRGAVSPASLARALGALQPGWDPALLADTETVQAHTGLQALLPRSAASGTPLPVVDEAGHYLGAITQAGLLHRLAAQEVAHG